MAKLLADEIHDKITGYWKIKTIWTTTAVTMASRQDGSIVAVVSGAGKRGLTAEQLEYVESITTTDEQGRPNMVALSPWMKEAHAETTAVHYIASNGLTPIAGATNRNARPAPMGCEDFLPQVGAVQTGPVTAGSKQKVPGQAICIWRDYGTWNEFLGAQGYR
ncbi:hypothetical protein ACIGEZ_32405 [Streptomyces sp. NPDC085481]|uniref:hypothetical protein n=1 Tax=Streptomyces sp. NPDC085481 TaxID=3365727 RepID=UPI0037CD1337